MLCFYFSYHYKLPFDVYEYTFDMRTNKVYLLTYLFMCPLNKLFDLLVGFRFIARRLRESRKRVCDCVYVSM